MQSLLQGSHALRPSSLQWLQTPLPEHMPVKAAAMPWPASGRSRYICQVACPADRNRSVTWVEPFPTGWYFAKISARSCAQSLHPMLQYL